MIEQRTPEWFEQRRNRVTGSAVGAILGLSPYMTRADAMRRMVRDALGAPSEFQGNPATEHGTFHEAGAIMDFQFEKGIMVTPAPFVMKEDWLGASPDGYTDDNGLIEVKCPYSLRATPPPVAFKPLSDQMHYFAQIQVQLYVTEREFCHFWQWAPHGTAHEIVRMDKGWLDANIPVLAQFYAEFLDELRECPEDHLAPKRATFDTPEAHKAISEWDEISEQLERLAERKKDLLSEIVSIAGEKNAIVAGRKVTLTERKGSVSYAKAIKALAPEADLTKWTGKGTRFWSIR